MGTSNNRQNRTAESKDSTEVRLLTFDGQMSAEALGGVLANARRSAVESRAAYLAQHPEYMPCAVAGCLGLVSPSFQRKAPDGTTYGLCPRQAAHALLMPELFGQTSPTA
jgi:hypothetical protein